MSIFSRHLCFFTLLGLMATPVDAVTYYVSSSSGNDANAGTSTAAPLRTLSAVNALALMPGDEVRLFCGETWTAETLRITRSGASGAPIVYGSHPAGCSDKPVLRGDRGIAGWSLHAGQIYVADLDDGANGGRFPNGINQLFDAAGRLPLGRWPNLDAVDGGWSTVDSQPSSARLIDAERPAGDWTGAVAHVKGIRWYILNREVTGSPGTALDLGADVQCWSGDCTGWGYFLHDHLLALDQDGEWHYDPASNRVYVVSSSGAPADGALSGSVVLAGDSDPWGMVVLGRHLQEHVAWVTIENLRLQRGFDAGVTTPLNLEADENQNLVIQDLDIVDMQSTGLRLRTWVWNAAANGSGPNGWRGGRGMLVRRNLIDGPNHFGIDSFARASTFQDNTVRDVARIANLARPGMGCGVSGTNCTENGDGIRLNHDSGSPNHTSRDLMLRRNHLQRIGMNGIDVFGRDIVLENNVIDESCVSKGDCGAVRTFGRTSLASSPVRNITLRGNLIRGIEGNTDGCRTDFDPLLGIGLYIDNFSVDVTVENNTITGASATGLLFQQSTGTATDNVLYDNADRTPWGMQLRLTGTQAAVSSFAGNTLFSLGPERWTIFLESLAQLSGSDSNRFWSPWRDPQIFLSTVGGIGYDLPGWQTASGGDGSSSAHTYSLGVGDPPRSVLLTNPSPTAALLDPGPGAWQDLDGQSVSTPVSVPAYGGRVLVAAAASIFADGFESGDTQEWSASVP